MLLLLSVLDVGAGVDDVACDFTGYGVDVDDNADNSSDADTDADAGDIVDAGTDAVAGVNIGDVSCDVDK